jgi:AraC-like DNA-binding protein
MEYLIGWRMALAKELLRASGVSVGEVAQRVGYSSSSTFSIAFSRQVEASPTTYARKHSPRRSVAAAASDRVLLC